MWAERHDHPLERILLTLGDHLIICFSRYVLVLYSRHFVAMFLRVGVFPSSSHLQIVPIFKLQARNCDSVSANVVQLGRTLD